MSSTSQCFSTDEQGQERKRDSKHLLIQRKGTIAQRLSATTHEGAQDYAASRIQLNSIRCMVPPRFVGPGCYGRHVHRHQIPGVFFPRPLRRCGVARKQATGGKDWRHYHHHKRADNPHAFRAVGISSRARKEPRS